MQSLEYLEQNNVEYRLIHLSEVPKSIKDVERLHGCPLHQILKTVVLIGDKPVIAVIQGDKRVSFQKIKELLNYNSIRMANPSEVEELSGYSIGGVSPFGIKNDEGFEYVLDLNVLNQEKVNIGSGKAEIGIELKVSELEKIWKGKISDITE